MKKKPVEVTIRELEDILERYLDTDNSINYAVKILGHPGVGKSAIVKEIARRKNFHFIDTRLAFKENIDLGGYPVPDHDMKQMIYYRPRFIPPESVPSGRDGIVWFLDEANRAHPTVIQTLFQIITEKTCGEHPLPEKTSIILAGNLGEGDNTTVTEFDDSALDGRLAIFHLRPTASDWLEWAARSRIHESIRQYISLFPDRLWDEANINPNPRGWHQVSQALTLSYGLDTGEALTRYLVDNGGNSLEKMIISLAGTIAGSDFIMQVSTPRLITTREVIAGDEVALEKMTGGNMPVEDVLWALSGAVSYFRDKSVAWRGKPGPDGHRELGNFLRFLGNARADMRVSFLFMLIRECGLLTHIPDALKTINNGEERRSLREKLGAAIPS